MAVYPDGTGKLKDKMLTWNDGLLDVYDSEHLEKEYAIDPKRIFATGLSNGGLKFIPEAKTAPKSSFIPSMKGVTPTQAIDASRLIWEFFKGHPKN